MIDRRSALKALLGGSASAALIASQRTAFAQEVGQEEPLETAQRANRRGLPPLKITDVKVILTEIGRNRYCNVKVMTDEPGLYGIGDGNHAERVAVVGQTVDEFLKPLVVGRNVEEIEDIWQTAYVAPYWRQDVDAFNAMAAIDGALWDIMGKRAGMPVYQLLGGKVRPACRMFDNARGATLTELEDNVRALMEDGYKHVRLRAVGLGPRWIGQQLGPQAGAGRSGGRRQDAVYIEALVREFDHLRNTVGWDVELSFDVHEYPHPSGALMLAKALEPYRPHFLEDLFAPEDVYWYERLREESAVGVAMGELFVSRSEWLPLVRNRWIDYMRAHISAIGGLNMARKIAAACEFYNVRTAWHGPSNVSPVGHAINLHLDLATYNFGIGEGSNFDEQTRELFPGAPEIREGLRYANDQPGFGIDIDETLAARYPLTAPGSNRGMRGDDGEPRRP
jgi:mannonate dehydratase